MLVSFFLVLVSYTSALLWATKSLACGKNQTDSALLGKEDRSFLFKGLMHKTGLKPLAVNEKLEENSAFGNTKVSIMENN